jgi:arylsulfatase A-like enzyme
MFADAELPRTPAFDEADVSDKPRFISGLPPLDQEQIGRLEAEYRRRLASLQAVDDMVASIVGAVAAVGVLENTYVIYSSDNGFHLGEHRLPAGKDFPYEEDIRVPAVVRGPGVPAGQRIEAMVLNSDLAPTFAEIAGIAPPDFVDGRSFLPLLEAPGQAWRESFLVERRQLEAQYVELAERLGLAPDGLDQSAQFDAIRTTDWIYVEYGTGERELYDLAGDPHQLDNVVETADPALVAALAARLAELRICGGADCRKLEDLPLQDEVSPQITAQPQ